MDTWCVDFGATTHISVTIHGCLWTQPPSDIEIFIYVADDNKVAVEAVGTFRLCSKTEIFLDLLRRFMYRRLDGI